MAKWKSDLLSQLGSFLSVFQSILHKVIDLSGNEVYMGRLNTEPQLVDDITQLILGRSMALPVYTHTTIRRRDAKEFTFLYCGCHIVAVCPGGGSNMTFDKWLRLGDTVLVCQQGELIEMTINRIESVDVTGETFIYGAEADSVEGENDELEYAVDDVKLREQHPFRCLQTEWTGKNDYQSKRLADSRRQQ